MKKQTTLLAATLVACGFQALSAGVVPCAGDTEFTRAGTLVPRSKPDPNDDQWMIGCEVLDRDFARFSAYKDYLPGLGIRSIRLQGGWAKCEKVKGVYDFAWLDEPVDFALAHGLNPVLETDYGNRFARKAWNSQQGHIKQLTIKNYETDSHCVIRAYMCKCICTDTL